MRSHNKLSGDSWLHSSAHLGVSNTWTQIMTACYKNTISATFGLTLMITHHLNLTVHQNIIKTGQFRFMLHYADRKFYYSTEPVDQKISKRRPFHLNY